MAEHNAKFLSWLGYSIHAKNSLGERDGNRLGFIASILTHISKGRASK